MQDRYTGDAGDFGKYGLLRALAGISPHSVPVLRVGVVWYLVPDESGNDDGKHVAYLQPSAQNDVDFRSCDSALYDTLSRIVVQNERGVVAVEREHILGEGARYFAEPLSFTVPGRDERLSHRRAWIDRALATTRDCDLVFMDPDNGIEPQLPAHRSKGPKYAYCEELALFTARSQSLVVYHHLGRNGTVHQQIEAKRAEIQRRLGLPNPCTALVFRRGTARAFFMLPGRAQADLLQQRVDAFLRSPWNRHFELV